MNAESSMTAGHPRGAEIVDKVLELGCAVLFAKLGSWEEVARRLEFQAAKCRVLHEVSDGQRDFKLRDPAIDASKLITSWFLTPQYVDEHGAPIPVKLRGEAPSLEALGATFGASSDAVDRWIELLMRWKAIRKTTGAQYVPVHQTVIVAEDEAAMHQRGATILNGLITTLVHNFREKKLASREFERNVHAAQLRASEIPAFRRFLATQGQMFIEAVDFWLDERQASAQEKSAEVIVEIFSNVAMNEAADRLPVVGEPAAKVIRSRHGQSERRHGEGV